MLNLIWIGLMVLAVIFGIANDTLTAVSNALMSSAQLAIEILIGLTGLLVFWLGLMKIAEQAGLVHLLARFLRPLLKFLFNEVPADHPAMGSMVMNMAANMLGLANAATPFGLKAMQDLESLNPQPGTATNAMCTFLAINTSSIQLIPTTMIAYLASAGASNPTGILIPVLLATLISTCIAIIAVKTLEKWPCFKIKAE